MRRQSLSVAKRLSFVALMLFGTSAQAFDKSHASLTKLLGETVQWNEEGHSTNVDYQHLALLRPALDDYLASLAAVSRQAFESWPRPDQLAFLINAYNGFTLQLILDHYPLESIKDTGSFWRSPWEKKFFTLFSEKMHLDHLEHRVIRNWPVYGDPRIHFAVNCASIGCPALRPEAYTGPSLELQLEDQTRRFLADKTRNRVEGSTLVISPIFKWYREDFEKPRRGAASLHHFFARYSQELGLNDIQRAALGSGAMTIKHNDYDWRLNGR